MPAIINPNRTAVAVASGQSQSIPLAQGFWEELEFNRFSFVALLLVVMVCLGGLAAAVAVGQSEWKLMAVALSTVTIEVLVMAVAPMRLIVLTAAVALLIDLLVFFL